MSELNNNIQIELQQLIQKTQELNNKLGSMSGFLVTMRSDNTDEHKTIINNSEQALILLKMIKRTINIYFIIIVLLTFLFFSKILITLLLY